LANKHDAMFTYMQGCPQISDLFFNFSTSENGNTVIATTSNEFEVESYIDKSALKWYDFAVIQFRPLSIDPNDDTNADILFDVEQVMEWVEAQEDAENYPDFGDKCDVQEISVLQDVPTVAGQDQTGAKYMFSCRVEYLERK